MKSDENMFQVISVDQTVSSVQQIVCLSIDMVELGLKFASVSFSRFPRNFILLSDVILES